MAIEKMEMINIIGQMDKVDDVIRRIILSSSVHVVNSITEIQQNSFPILEAQDNLSALVDYNYIKQYTSQKNLGEIQKKVDGLMDIFELKRKVKMNYIKKEYDFKSDTLEINRLYEIIEEKHKKRVELCNEIEENDRLQQYLIQMKELNSNLNEILSLKFFRVKVGVIPRYNMEKLKLNYENVSAIIYKLFQDSDKAVILVLMPENVEIEVNRVLSSLSFDEYKITPKFQGTPLQWLKSINIRKNEIEKELGLIRLQLVDMKKKYGEDILKYYSRLMMEHNIENVKSNIACTNEFFYFTGWVPEHKKKSILKTLQKYEDDLIFIFKEVEEVREGMNPPTCLKNNYLIRPFEALINLYGIPSYNESDPTVFVGLSYMLLFGAMFGDVGQGFVLFAVGEFLNRFKHRPNLGGVLSRLGISSMVFGFLYGSFFGFEDVLKTYVIRPMEEINTTLVAAIALGVVFLSIGFIFNLINAYKQHDIENGIFSRNGLVGLCFYWLLLYYIGASLLNRELLIPANIIIGLLILMLLFMLLKEPLAHLIKGVRPLYSESASDYYVEGGFGIVETLLSLFSNTISFIRVGAFAINHVGLFIAFATLAEMMSNKFESGLMFVIGNIVIIGLEGLIVFIQGLRLEYYELFSKYFNGLGYEYSPCKLQNIYFEKKSRITINTSIKQKYTINME